MLLFATVVVAICNAIYISDLYMLWHDDNQSYHFAGLNQMSGRLPEVSRHMLVDSFFLHILADVSPFVARIAVILLGGVPLLVLSYTAYRFIFRLRHEVAAFASAAPLVVAGQWEVFVGVNLSYIVFDAAIFFAALLILKWASSCNQWAATALASVSIAFALSDGMVSSILLAPVLLFAAYFIRPDSLYQTGVIAVSIIGATLKAVQEQNGTGRARFADEPVKDLIQGLQAPLDFLLPGGWVPATIALLILGAWCLIGLLWSLRDRRAHPVLTLGFAAALYVVPVAVYSLFRPSFPNRYAFLPTIAVFLAVGVLLHLIIQRLPEKLGRASGDAKDTWAIPSGHAGLAVLVLLGALAYHKSQYEAPLFQLINRATKQVADYFNPPSDPIAGMVRLNTGAQLLVLSENGFPYMYPHRYPALGYLRFVTGNPTAVGFAGSRRLCADPFQPWNSPWSVGPGGFSPELPFSAHAFRGQNGSGTPINHMLSTTASDLDAPESHWVLYEIGEIGAIIAAEGTGRSALEAELARLAIEPHHVAFSCGL